MTNWITDDKGNRASVEYFGSEEAAQAALDSLRDCTSCTNCTNCTDCAYCKDCTNCTDCAYCKDCTNCTNCTYCTNCDLSRPYFFMPVSEPRGHTWLAIWESGAWRIRAGCRSYSVDEARAHWTDSAYDGPDTVRSTAGMALDWLERQHVPGRSK